MLRAHRLPERQQSNDAANAERTHAAVAIFPVFEFFIELILKQLIAILIEQLVEFQQ